MRKPDARGTSKMEWGKRVSKLTEDKQGDENADLKKRTFKKVV